MSTKSNESGSSIHEGIVEPGIEPGASGETMLVNTDTFEELEQEISNAIDNKMKKEIISTSETQETKPALFVPDEDMKNDMGFDAKLVCLI